MSSLTRHCTVVRLGPIRTSKTSRLIVTLVLVRVPVVMAFVLPLMVQVVEVVDIVLMAFVPKVTVVVMVGLVG